MKNNRFLSFILHSFRVPGFANVSLPSFFSDNMVLQRNADVKLWGWGNAHEEITITTGWDNAEYKVKTDDKATWSLTIKTPHEGGPYIIKFKGRNELVLKNVMLGEVWLCSGQSNMEWTAANGITNAEAAIAAANYPDIRFFKAAKLTAKDPQTDMPGDWEPCTPETMRNFGAVSYFFAERLHSELKGVPAGIINSSWSGTPAEIWIPEEHINNDKVLADAAAKLTNSPWGPNLPGRAYNAMIHPLAGFKIAGVLWYQGESNVGSGVYEKTLSTLIATWRSAWQDNFPFYYVQIAPYNYEGNTTQGVTIRNAQRKVLKQVNKTGMVVISDISPAGDIHPRNKKPVGIRLANLALSSIYRIDKGEVNSPLYKGFKADGNKLTIYFDNADGLHFTNKTSALFEIAANDGVYHLAKAIIEKNTVIVTSEAVAVPAHVRYAWHNTAQADLFNSAGLPASSFISE